MEGSCVLCAFLRAGTKAQDSHIHGFIYRERGLLTTRKKNILKILPFLEAIWLPRQSAVLHCWAADLVAGQMALRPVGPVDILMIHSYLVLHETPW